MLDDLTAVLNPLAGGTNVNEMKNLVTQYFDQLSSNPNIDFQSFRAFIVELCNKILYEDNHDNQYGITQSYKIFVELI
jgi:hypothetical protein